MKNIAQAFIVGRQFIKIEKLHALDEVKSLRIGESEATDNHRRKRVTEEDFRKVIANVNPVVADMLKLIWLTAMRPYEVCEMQPFDILRDDPDCWIYIPGRDSSPVGNSTPRYAQIVSGKYTRFGADSIREDLLECNGREISRNYAKKLSDFVGAIAACHEAEWEYDLPKWDRPVHAITLGLDGTCMLMHNAGWREAMCGSIAFYDAQGERLHTIYCSAIPEYGKEKFKAKFSREIERVKATFPNVLYIGQADGAKDNWTFLENHASRLLLDFYHAREYLGKAASAIFGRDEIQKTIWEEQFSHDLKHQPGAAGRVIEELEKQRAALDKKNWIERDEELRQVIT